MALELPSYPLRGPVSQHLRWAMCGRLRVVKGSITSQLIAVFPPARAAMRVIVSRSQMWAGSLS